MNLRLSLAALALLATISSCTTYTKTMREPNARVEFEKQDFIFSDQVGAKARIATGFFYALKISVYLPASAGLATCVSAARCFFSFNRGASINL